MTASDMTVKEYRKKYNDTHKEQRKAYNAKYQEKKRKQFEAMKKRLEELGEVVPSGDD